MSNSEFRNSKLERVAPAPQTAARASRAASRKTGSRAAGFWRFEFVSNFGFRISDFRLRRFAWLAPLFLAGCATYHARPLPAGPDLASSPALNVPARQFGIPGIEPHPFNPTNGLDETEVTMLAVVNNPDLKAERLRAGVAEAQMLEAGLLPDPTVSAGLSHSALHEGYSVVLGEDLRALITRGASRGAARAHERQVNLEILWQEWQVAGQARKWFIQARADDRLEQVLAAIHHLLADRYHWDEAALKAGDVTGSRVSSELAAVVEADQRLRECQLGADRTRHELNQLLGLEPDVKLDLVGGGASRVVSRDELQAAIQALPRRRPDLLALQAGYQSQEQRLREAILSQFPDMSAGVAEARSAEEGIHTVDFKVNLTLPIFNGNRGGIAIERATRAVLYRTYQARLDRAAGQADQVWRAAGIMAREYHDLERRLPALEEMATAATQNFRDGNLDADSYLSIETNYLNEKSAAVHLSASLAQAKVALETLLGLPPGLPSQTQP